MGILSRFKDIMASNINALLDKNGDPEKEVEQYMRGLNADLGQVRAETASVLADERRAQRALADCQAEISKLQRYAEKCAADGNDADARKFLEKKRPLQEKEAQLQAAYDAASDNMNKMKQLEDKLERDIGDLQQRYTKLKERMAEAKRQQRINASGSPVGGSIDAAFKAAEEKVDMAYNEAMAIAELRNEKKENIDELFEQWEKNKKPETE